MNIVNLLKLKPPYKMGQISPEFITADLIEYGVNSTGDIGFGSYVTCDGLTSFVAYKQYTNTSLEDYRKFKRIEPYPYNRLNKQYKKGYVELYLNNDTGCYFDSKVKWLNTDDGDNSHPVIEVTTGPIIKFRIVNRSTLLKYFKHYKNTSKPAPEELITKIKKYIAKEDKLPDEANLIMEIDYKSINRRELRFDFNGPFIDEHNVWKIRAVNYRGRIVILVSPDAGLYRFKPVFSLPRSIDKNNETNTGELARALDMIIVPNEVKPVYIRNVEDMETLYDPQHTLGSYLIRNVIWPALITSRSITAIVHIQPTCSSVRYISSNYISNNARLIISQYKTTAKPVINVLNVTTKTKPKYWLQSVVSLSTALNILTNKDNVIWSPDKTTLEALISNLKFYSTLQEI